MGKWLFITGCIISIFNPVVGAVVIFCGVMAWMTEKGHRDG